MATRLEQTRAIFAERVLPGFPNAKERFKKHFRESYNLIRNFSANERILLNSNMDMTLTILGVKPLTTLLHFTKTELNRIRLLLSEAGLEINIRRAPDERPHLPDNVEIYDPVSAAFILSKMLNRNIMPEMAGNALQEVDDGYSAPYAHELLGYPQSFDSTKGPGLFLRVKSLSFTDRYPDFACSIHTPDPVVPMLTYYVAAAALAEDIKQTSPKIISVAAIEQKTENSPARDISIITRRVGVGEWSIDSSTISRLSYVLPSPLFWASVKTRNLFTGTLPEAIRLWPRG